ncbi:hypothetical protein G7Y89_g15812 [Cudoniella acicularis]|uniref:Heterokaryon incompatibility domain-containing protein n=1 Tax=Cudoniella acicularis TaxID=354080 RepID=A0A8H4QFM6_9HELO|nr:hypothetical protein G7Y89_g15812 [Cudoniella acicularis]
MKTKFLKLAHGFGGVEREIPYYNKTSFMKSSAEDGCLLCEQFLAIYKSQIQLEVESNTIEITGARKPYSPKTGLGKSPSNSMPLVKQWLKDCAETHNCFDIYEESSLPTWLIYVGGENRRLVLSDGIEGCLKYATLSHCWGTLKFPTMSQSNLVTFINEIPLEPIPKNFSDAIKAVQALTLDYIWIDSLCIIQDKDFDDWAKESAQMSSLVRAFHGGQYTEYMAARPLEYRGPSWSWISVDTVTILRNPFVAAYLLKDAAEKVPEGNHIFTGIIAEYIEYLGPDIYGEVSSASLELDCDILYPVSWNEIHADSTELWGFVFWRNYIFDCADEQDDKETILYLLPTMCPITGRIWGLLLKATGMKQEEYRRVGHFDITNSVEECLVAMRNAKGAPRVLSHYSEIQKETDGTIKHIIILV